MMALPYWALGVRFLLHDLVPAGGRNARHTFGVAQPRPCESIERDEGEAEHRHNETARKIVAVGNRAHHFRQDCAAHDGHDNERRRTFCALPQSENSERKDGRKHDRHEKVSEENAGDSNPAKLGEDQQTEPNRRGRVKTEDGMRREFFQNGAAGEATDEKTKKA